MSSVYVDMACNQNERSDCAWPQATPRYDGPMAPLQGELTPPLLPVQAWQDVPQLALEQLEPLGAKLLIDNFDIRQGQSQFGAFDIRDDQGQPFGQGQQFGQQQCQAPAFGPHLSQQYGQQPHFDMGHSQQFATGQQVQAGSLGAMGYQDYYSALVMMNPAVLQQAAALAAQQMQPIMQSAQPARERRQQRRPRRSEAPPCSAALAQLRQQHGQLLSADLLRAALDLATDAAGARALCDYLETAPRGHALAQALEQDVLRLSLQPNGCRVVQKLLEEVPTETQLQFCAGLRGRVLQCVESQHGNHVVQKILERLPPQSAQFVVDEVVVELITLCPHQFGCRVVQRMLEHCLPRQTAALLDHVRRELFTLCREQYGNYVVQHVVEHGRAEDRSAVFGLIAQRPIELACHKYGANVVERCLLLADQQERATLIAALVGTDRKLQQLVSDRFANYALQRILDVAAPTTRREVYTRLQAHRGALQQVSYGKHVLAKLEDLEPQMRA